MHYEGDFARMDGVCSVQGVIAGNREDVDGTRGY